MRPEWFLLPLVAAGIGWFTNFLAVRMIFRPRRPIGWGPLRIQGLLPKRHREFAENIGATVEEHLLTVDDIKAMVEDPQVKAKLHAEVASKIDRFIAERLVAAMPMLGAFLKAPMMEGIKSSLVEEVEDVLSEGVLLLSEHLEQNMDLKTLVQEKVMGFDFDQLEEICLRVASRELRAIELLGALLGFLVGLIQLLLLEAMR